RYSVHDGPGIRTIVFFKGCPLRCAWCSNPETQSRKPELLFDDAKCIHCGHCIKVCPTRAVSLSTENTIMIDRRLCQACGHCVELCPGSARKIAGRYVSVEEVFKQLVKDELFYRNSNGGITFSGGEPVVQSAFAKELAYRCNEAGLQVALETCGYSPWKRLERVIKSVSLVLYDIKNMSGTQHQRFTGVSNKLILRNARAISDSKVPMIIRIPVIPGFNDSKENIISTTVFAKGLASVSEIHLISYHELGIVKYGKLCRGNTWQGPVPNLECLEILQQLVESMGVKAVSYG
ncbi:glycyl-radical enzyme activating protein, partial [Chloroflexota bacterium]